ncbi:4-hydroxythreonine-4-phosphate dehydrogenase PdxA [Longimicrobium terrae]|uniref:4-hydroxythreonine-4-phosphate dehydrogenase n=1 Tax=Longimicrobium terrae TaxID=1639882 RepID=A0A841H2J8_9BACT|nr:4-hydroxythreonine-4-phosphate dehydrogenase [Longimicrobium terrae]MBB6072385.1 4-hydroxythreonine-4-phosphate dehydrogenase [Longimicrobium terrae]NNC31303.1 4-hydroxythreonine-4-phosphate dehydrogenase PdxA [Longimicrobium terrae]
MPERRLPRIAITLGDPRGIGPEVTAGALSDPELASAADYVLVGPRSLLRPGTQDVSVGEWSAEQDEASAGRIAGEAIRRAVEMAMVGEVDALVTAPIEKYAFRAGGWHYPGHTEMLGELSGAPEVVMMMAAERTALGGPLRVVLATTHLALRDVPAALSTDLLVHQATITAEALTRQWGIERPRVALCAVNPHASDGGLFGDEEARIVQPALQRLREAGVDAFGPIPADTVFTRAVRGEFDAVIAPYHDVGMAAFKTAAFGAGVNVTLGLPFPRTSPDHGTALDIAGTGRADPSSMKEAVRLAIRLSRTL